MKCPTIAKAGKDRGYPGDVKILKEIQAEIAKATGKKRASAA